MNAKIQASYPAQVHFEISVTIAGESYLIIYGEHINGNFCCVPDRGWGCEMTEPSDLYYNSSKLQSCGAKKEIADSISKAIKEFYETDDKIEYWHTHDTGNSLREFLGMSKSQYENFLFEKKEN